MTRYSSGPKTALETIDKSATPIVLFGHATPDQTPTAGWSAAETVRRRSSSRTQRPGISYRLHCRLWSQMVKPADPQALTDGRASLRST